MAPEKPFELQLLATYCGGRSRTNAEARTRNSLCSSLLLRSYGYCAYLRAAIWLFSCLSIEVFLVRQRVRFGFMNGAVAVLGRRVETIEL